MPQSEQRYRKTAILTPQGLQKLEAAKSIQAPWNSHSKACTLENLSERTGLSTHTLSKIHTGKAGVDQRSLVRYFSAFDLTLESEDYTCPVRLSSSQSESATTAIQHCRAEAFQPTASIVSWGLAPDLPQFYGRTTELATLKHWILVDRCRLITLLGLPGVGKTYLATRLTEQLQSEFKVVIWRSLQPLGRSHSPIPFDDFLDDLISHLIPDHDPLTSESTTAKVQQLITHLDQTRCLVILDAVESVWQNPIVPEVATHPLAKQQSSIAEAYRYFIKHVGLTRHQSCMLLTSRVEPQPFQLMLGNAPGIRMQLLRGLSIADIQQMFAARGNFRATPTDWERFVDYYDGNPQMLGMLSRTIQSLFQGNIVDFLRQDTLTFGLIREVFEHPLSRLSDTEKEVLKTLATYDTPRSFSEMRSHLFPTLSTTDLLEAIHTLKLWSLIDMDINRFALPPFLRDYIHKRRELTLPLQLIDN